MSHTIQWLTGKELVYLAHSHMKTQYAYTIKKWKGLLVSFIKRQREKKRRGALIPLTDMQWRMHNKGHCKETFLQRWRGENKEGNDQNHNNKSLKRSNQEKSSHQGLLGKEKKKIIIESSGFPVRINNSLEACGLMYLQDWEESLECL